MKDVFNIEKDGEILTAKILLVFEFNNKKYISYALEENENSFNIYISRLNELNKIETIDNLEEKDLVFLEFDKYLKNMI